MSVPYVGEGNTNLLPGRIVEDQHLSVFAKAEAGENLASLSLNRHHAERHVDIATRIQSIFEKPVEAAIADAVETGAECLTYFADLMAIGANAFREDSSTCLGVEGSCQEVRAPLSDQLFDATIFWR